jgi:4-amino-4-deoxy-L-arabinose transferase-like glycosyltransferase
LLLLPTTVGMIGFSHAAATDMPFAGMLSIAMVFAAILLGLTRNPYLPVVPGTPWRVLISFGFFLGLAVLAKGPAAIVLAGGAVLLWAAFTKGWRDSLQCLHPAAIVSFCVTALPWYILCSRRNPDFFRIFIIEHNFKRYLTPEFQHIQPFWYYVPILLIAFAPWTLALIWSAVHGALSVTSARRPSTMTLLLLCWSVFCIIFFSISKSKLPGYILPAVPAIGLLLAHAYVALAPLAEKSFRWLHFAFAFTSIPAALVLLGMRGSIREILVAGGPILLAFGLANLLLTFRRALSIYAIGMNSLCVVPILTLLVFFPTISSPWFHYDPSGKTLAHELAERQIPLDQLYIAKMNRGQEYSLNFYTHHELQNWEKENPKSGYLLTSSKACSPYVSLPFVCSETPTELLPSGWFVYQVERRKD